MNYPNKRDCEHGSKKGSCNTCDLEQEIAELKAQVELYRELLNDDQILFDALDDQVHPNIELDARASSIREQLNNSPEQCLNDIKASAIREATIKCSISFDDIHGNYWHACSVKSLDDYADRLEQENK